MTITIKCTRTTQIHEHDSKKYVHNPKKYRASTKPCTHTYYTHSYKI